MFFRFIKSLSRKENIVWPTAIAMVLACFFTFNKAQEAKKIYFYAHAAFFTETEQPICQLFYNIGQGYNELDSAFYNVKKKSVFLDVNFELPRKKLIALRFDPFPGSGKVLIQHLALKKKNGDTVYAFSPDEIIPIHDIDFKTVDKAVTSIQTKSNAIDPAIEISLPDESLLNQKLSLGFKTTAFLFTKAFLVLLIFFTGIFYLASRNFFPEKHALRMHYFQAVSEKQVQQKITSLFIASVAAYVFVLFCRSWVNLTSPGLFVEDATHYFNIYYGGKQPFSFILRNPHGYFNVFNNLTAWLVSHVDVRLQPYLYLLTGTVLAIITSSCLIFTKLFKSRGIILIVPTVLGLTGLNHIFYYTTLTYQMYIVVVLLLCLMFFPPPRSTGGMIGMGIVYLILIWSGPYSAVSLPTAILFLIFFQDRRKNILLIWIIISVLTYIITAQGLVQAENILNPQIVKRMVAVLFERIFFLDLPLQLSGISLLLFFLFLTGTAYFKRQDRKYFKYSTILFAIIITSLAPLFLSVKFSRYSNASSCHLLIPQFFWIAFLLYTADGILRKLHKSSLPHIIAVTFFIALVIADNIHNPSKGHHIVSHRLQNFLDGVHAAERLDLQGKNQFVQLLTEGSSLNFDPIVIVGSREQGSKRLTREDIKDIRVKKYVKDRKE